MNHIHKNVPSHWTDLTTDLPDELFEPLEAGPHTSMIQPVEQRFQIWNKKKSKADKTKPST